jgi:hypothetical protein
MRKSAHTRKLIGTFFASTHANRERHELCIKREGSHVELEIQALICMYHCFQLK